MVACGGTRGDVWWSYRLGPASPGGMMSLRRVGGRVRVRGSRWWRWEWWCSASGSGGGGGGL